MELKGYPDLVFYAKSKRTSTSLLINQGGKSHFLSVKLKNDAHSLGAKLTLITGSGKSLKAQFFCNEGLLSDQSHVLTFGLGEEKALQRLSVNYVDGSTKVIDSPKADATLVL